MDTLTLVIVVIVVLALLGYFGRGFLRYRFRLARRRALLAEGGFCV